MNVVDLERLFVRTIFVPMVNLVALISKALATSK